MRSVNSLRTLSLNLAKQEQRLQQRLLSSDQPPHPKEPSNDDERQRASAPTESLQSAALSRSSADNEERRGAAQTTARRKQKKSRANFKSAAPTAQTLQPARGAGRSRKALPRAMDARGSTRRSAHVSAASAAADMTARRAAPARESKQSARSASLKSRAEQRTSEPAVDRRPSRSNVMLFRSPAVAKTNEMAARKPAIQPAAAAAAQKCNSKQPPPALLRRSLPDKKSVSRSYEKSLVQKKADNAQSDAEKLAQALRAPFTIQDQGWATEKADGMVFYWHKATKTSQWRHPWMVQGGRVIWRKSTGAVGSKAVPLEIGTLVSAVYQIRPVDEAVRAAAAFEAGTSTQGDAGRPKWPKNYVVDISLSERTSQLGGKMPRLTHRIVDRVPVVELECIAPPIKSLSDKRREVAAGWRSTAIDDSKLPPSASFQAGAPSQQHRSADEHALVALCPRNHALHGFVASSTYQCDVCSASLVPGATAFGCRRCDFDLCSQCYHEPLLQNCPGNHGLCHSDPADRRDLVFTCDLCDKPIPASGTTNGVRGGMYSCRECDFDICASCHRDPARAKCPGHHELKGSRTTDDGYRCDRCSKNCPAQTLLYSCRSCDYDLCENCYVTAGGASAERLRVSEVIERAFVAFADRPCLGFQPSGGVDAPGVWAWLSYSRVFELMRGLGDVLHAMGVAPGSYVGMSAENSPAYFIAYYALILGGWRPIALSLHLSDENASHIVQEANLAAVFVARGVTFTRFKRIAAAAGGEDEDCAPATPGAAAVVPHVLNCLHLQPDNLLAWVHSTVQEWGAAPALAPAAPDGPTGVGSATAREDLENPLLILYTSGSTGKPKGAVMSERSFLSELKDMVRVDEADTSSVDIIDAPMATSATPYNIAGTLVTGGRLVVYPELVRVFDVAREIGPSTLGLVPQLWAVFFKRFQQDLKERVGALGLGATAEASVEPTNGENPTLTAVRRALMIEYQLERLGWRVSGLNCGGATPMPRVQRWLKSVYEGRDCSVTENYASTEAGPITNSWGELEGVVSAGVVIKLLDWGEYKSSDKPFPRGELLVKSAAMSTGYLNRPDLTASTFDEDGFYHTGDVVELVDNGPPQRVRVVDRCKNIFKLLNGEWVSPENVEAELTALCPAIKQIMVHGTSKHECVVAVVVPAAIPGQKSTFYPKTIILEQLRRAGESASGKLRHFEVPLDVVVATELALAGGFTPDNGMLTQTNKLCRPAIRSHFQTALDQLLVAQHEAMESKKAAQQNTMVQILKKYLPLVNKEVPADGKVTVTPDDQAAWASLEWSSMAATYNHAVIQMHFKRTETLSVAAVWNGGHGRGVLELADIIARVQNAASGDMLGAESKGGGAIDWQKECSVVGLVPDRATGGAAPLIKTSPSATPILFVTGCTGFLGAALLASIVQLLQKRQCTVDVWCLVRVGKNADPPPQSATEVDSHAVERLVAALRSREQMSKTLETTIQGLSDKSGNTDHSGAPNVSVYAVRGDLGLPSLGLTPALFEEVGSRLSCVLHCGSYVNHIFDYTAMRAPNSDSIIEVARMAALSQFEAAPDIVYVSTISVLDDDGTEADDGDEEYIRHSGGYAQSKWVAEKRLRNLAVEQPDLFSSVTIVRPGLVGFDTRSGSANRTDWFVRFLIGSLQIGGLRLPDPGSEGAIHVTPVDHAAAFFNCVLQRRCALFGGCPLSSAASVAVAGFVSTLHLPLTVAMPTNHFLVTFMERAADNGRLMRIMDGKEWNQTIDELPRENAFWPFKEQFHGNGLDGIGSHKFDLTASEYSQDPEAAALCKGQSNCENLMYSSVMINSLIEHLLRTEPLLRRRLLIRTLSAKAY